jgi:ribosome production factor 1
MSTPLGLSIGRLLGTLFPPLPQLQGRQVVAVHHQRDFLFVRRFRYLFALRATDDEAQRRAEERGMDKDVRTRMQEIGPRMTLKLRWLKRGTLADGRRKAGGGVTGEQTPKRGAGKAKEGADDEGEVDAGPEVESGGEEEATIDQGVLDDDAAAVEREGQVGEAPEDDGERKERTKGPRRKTTFSRKTGDLMIPKLKPTPDEIPHVGNLAKGRRKPKKGASILDSVNLQGGVLDSRKEWNWDVRVLAKVASVEADVARSRGCRSRSESSSFECGWTWRMAYYISCNTHHVHFSQCPRAQPQRISANEGAVHGPPPERLAEDEEDDGEKGHAEHGDREHDEADEGTALDELCVM